MDTKIYIPGSLSRKNITVNNNAPTKIYSLSAQKKSSANRRLSTNRSKSSLQISGKEYRI